MQIPNCSATYLVSLGGVDLDVLGVVVLGEGGWGEGVQKTIVLEQSTDVYEFITIQTSHLHR